MSDDWKDKVQIGEKEDGSPIYFSLSKGIKEGLVDPVVSALKLPGDVFSGKTPVYTGGEVDEWSGEYQPQQLNPEVVERGTELAGGVALGGLGASRVLEQDIDENTLGMFLGTSHRLADKNALDRAEIMEETGRTPEEIWMSTGWWKKPDGNWAFEVSDEGFKATDEGQQLVEFMRDKSLEDVYQGKGIDTEYTTKAGLEDVFYHPKLKGDLDIPLTLRTKDADQLQYNAAYFGSYGGKNNPEIEASLFPKSKTDFDEGLKSTVLHEIQHYFQDVEGWAGKGSNLAIADASIKEVKKSFPKIVRPLLENFEQYSRLSRGLKSKQDLIEELKGGSELPDRWSNVPNTQAFKKHILRNLESDVELIKNKLNDLEDSFTQNMTDRDRQILEAFKEPIEEYIKISEEVIPYRTEEGEAIARLTQKRADLSDSERSLRFPEKDLDVDKESIWDDRKLLNLRLKIYDAWSKTRNE